MKKSLVSLLATSLLWACTPQSDGPPRGEIYDGMPPARFRSDTTVRVQFVTNVPQACYELGASRVSGSEIEGCGVIRSNGDHLVVLKNPCRINSKDSHLIMQCHELGHINGWTNNHER